MNVTVPFLLFHLWFWPTITSHMRHILATPIVGDATLRCQFLYAERLNGLWTMRRTSNVLCWRTADLLSQQKDR